MNKLKSSKFIVSLSILILMVLGWNFTALAETYRPGILETPGAICNGRDVAFHDQLEERRI